MEQKIWNAAFVGAFLANSMTSLGQQMMHVLVSLYADSLGATSTLVGFAVSAFAYTALGLRVISGPAIDAFSKKKLLAASVLVIATSYAMFAVSSNIALLIAGRLLQGVGVAFTTTCCLAMAADALPPNRLNTGIGFFSLSQAICMAIGPATALFLADVIGYSATFAISSVFMVATFIVALRIKEKPHPRRPFKITLTNIFAPEAAVPAATAALLTSAFSNVNSFLALCAADRGVEGIGAFFTVNALLLFVSRPLVGSLTDRFGFMRMALPCILSFALSFVIISQATSLWMFLIAAAFSAFGFGATGPILEACCIESVPPERRGAGSGTYFTGLDVGSLAGPVIAGTVVESHGYGTMWLVMIIPIALAFVLLVVFRKRIAEIEAHGAAMANEAKG